MNDDIAVIQEVKDALDKQALEIERKEKISNTISEGDVNNDKINTKM